MANDSFQGVTPVKTNKPPWKWWLVQMKCPFKMVPLQGININFRVVTWFQHVGNVGEMKGVVFNERHHARRIRANFHPVFSYPNGHQHWHKTRSNITMPQINTAGRLTWKHVLMEVWNTIFHIFLSKWWVICIFHVFIFRGEHVFSKSGFTLSVLFLCYKNSISLFIYIIYTSSFFWNDFSWVHRWCFHLGWLKIRACHSAGLILMNEGILIMASVTHMCKALSSLYWGWSSHL